MGGSTRGGMRSASSMASFQPDPSPREQPGDAGVGGVGDVQGAAGQRPRHPGVDRAEAEVAAALGIGQVEEHGQLGGRLVRGHPDALCRSTRQIPTVRRSCQPMPGPTGSPVARSHTMVEARWLAMPTPSTGPPAVKGGVGHLEHGARPWLGRRTRRSPARATWAAPRRSGRRRRCRRRRRGGAHAGGADVDDEDAHRPAELPERRRQSELARIEDAARVECVLDGAEGLEGCARGRRP